MSGRWYSQSALALKVELARRQISLRRRNLPATDYRGALQGFEDEVCGGLLIYFVHVAGIVEVGTCNCFGVSLFICPVDVVFIFLQKLMHHADKLLIRSVP